jgi:hypothetical protein
VNTGYARTSVLVPTFVSCLYRKLDSTIMVMKSAEDRPQCDAAYRPACCGALAIGIAMASLRRKGTSYESSSDPFSYLVGSDRIYWISGLLYDVDGIVLKFQTGSQSRWLVLGLAIMMAIVVPMAVLVAGRTALWIADRSRAVHRPDRSGRAAGFFFLIIIHQPASARR